LVFHHQKTSKDAMYNFYLRRKALDEQHVRRQNPATYTEPLQGSPITKKFISEFANKIRQKDEMDFYNNEQAKYPDLKLHFEKLVPLEVSYEEFWRRYEYRTDLNRIMDEMKSARTSQSSTDAAKGEIQSLRRKIFKRLHMNGDANAEEHPVTSDSSEPSISEAHEDHHEQHVKTQHTNENPVLEEIESASESDYSDFDGPGIHAYPEKPEDEDEDDIAVELNHMDLELSASEFDADAIDDLRMEAQVHMYPDSILENNEGSVPVFKFEDKMEDRIIDDEYGSLDFNNSEFGSLGQIGEPDEIDDDVKMLGEIFDEDNFVEDVYLDDKANGEADKCECACVIS